MKVAGGLDSLVVGEGQILSQMKRCLPPLLSLPSLPPSRFRSFLVE